MTQATHSQLQLDLDHVFEALEQPLALIDNPERRAELQRYLQAARVHQERAIFDLLSSVTAAVNETGLNGRLALQYSDGRLSLAVEPRSEQDDEADGFFSVDDEVERVTVRLPARLKLLVDQAAALRGLSVNRWYVRTLTRAIFRQPRDGRQYDDQSTARPERQGRRGRRGQALRGPGEIVAGE